MGTDRCGSSCVGVFGTVVEYGVHRSGYERFRPCFRFASDYEIVGRDAVVYCVENYRYCCTAAKYSFFTGFVHSEIARDGDFGTDRRRYSGPRGVNGYVRFVVIGAAGSSLVGEPVDRIVVVGGTNSAVDRLGVFVKGSVADAPGCHNRIRDCKGILLDGAKSSDAFAAPVAPFRTRDPNGGHP